MPVGYIPDSPIICAQSLHYDRVIKASRYRERSADSHCIRLASTSRYTYLSPNDAIRFGSLLQRFALENFDLNEVHSYTNINPITPIVLNDEPNIPAAQVG